MSEDTWRGKRFERDGHVQLSKPKIRLYCTTLCHEDSRNKKLVQQPLLSNDTANNGRC
jgi:hypothetical protein